MYIQSNIIYEDIDTYHNFAKIIRQLYRRLPILFPIVSVHEIGFRKSVTRKISLFSQKARAKL